MSEDDILKDKSKYEFKGIEEFGLKIIENQLDSLGGFNDLARLIESDKHWRSTVRLVRVGYKLISFENAELQEKAFNLYKKNKNYVKIFDLYIWLLIDYKSLDFNKTKPDPPNLYCYNQMTQNERKIYMLCWINGLVNCLMSISDEITEFAIQRGLIERLLTVLDDHDFLDKIQTHLKQSLGSFISGIYCLSANPEQYKQLWLSAKAIKILEKILEKEKFSKFSISIFCTILTIASDDDLEALIHKNEYIDRIVKLIVDGANEANKIYRSVEVYDAINNKTHQFKHMEIHDTDTSDLHTLRSIIELLYRMAVNSKAKEILYKKKGLTEAVKKIFKEGNEHEKSTALDYFAQLCFDNQIRKDITQDVELILRVKEIIASSSNVMYKPLIRSCEQFIWLLEEEQPDAAKAESKQNQENAQDGHIMISYNKFNRDLCLKIKNELENIGLKVWIDLRDLHGSILGEMARAVETAKCVLICVTEKYRQSIYCQAEAKHAFKFEKKIIPLIMQEGYAKVGDWLGFIMGDRMCIDFTNKKKFEESIKKLKYEISMCQSNEEKSTNQSIERLQSTKQQANAQTNDHLICSFVSRNDAKEWDNLRVKDWFNEMNLQSVYEVLKPLNGSTLHEIYKLKINTPELFSQLLSHSFKNNNCINLIQAVQFGSCLENLFKIRN